MESSVLCVTYIFITKTVNVLTEKAKSNTNIFYFSSASADLDQYKGRTKKVTSSVISDILGFT